MSINHMKLYFRYHAMHENKSIKEKTCLANSSPWQSFSCASEGSPARKTTNLSPLSLWAPGERKTKVKYKKIKKSLNSLAALTTNSSLLLSDFVDIQRKSFFELLENGLIEEFSKRNPITTKNLEIFFYPEYYQLTPPEYNPRRAILYSKSYSAKLFVPAQLTDKTLKKSQLKWVLIGNLPLMTKRGHFILNGAPRVIVNQILRSPGIYFQGSFKEIFSEKWSEKPDITYKRYYTDLISLRGTWLRIEVDKNKDIWAQMKKVPKIPILWFLLALGLTERIIFKSVINPTRLLANFNLEIKRNIIYKYITNASDAWKEIYNLIYDQGGSRRSKIKEKIYLNKFSEAENNEITKSKQNYKIKKVPKNSSLIYKKGALPHKKSGEKVKLRSHTHLPLILRQKGRMSLDFLLVKDWKKGPLTLKKITKPKKFPWLASPKIHRLLPREDAEANQDPVFFPRRQKKQTPLNSPVSSEDPQAKKKGVRGSSLLTFSEQSKHDLGVEGRNWIFKRFLNPRTYDLGKQGRLNFNRKLGLAISSNQTTLTAQDVLYATDHLLKLELGLKKIDDIDHLKNRRVRTSGELLQIQIGIGLIRLEKIIRESLKSYIALQIIEQTKKTRERTLPLKKKIGSETNIALQSPGFLLSSKKRILHVRGKMVESVISKKVNNKTLQLRYLNTSLQEKGKRNGKGKKKEKGNAKVELKINTVVNTKAFNGALREFFGTCLTPDHNVLTDKGFISIKEVTCKHKVATLKNEELVYEHPIKVHNYDHDGQMYEVNVPGLSLKTTLNHRMFVQLKTDKRIKEEKVCFSSEEQGGSSEENTFGERPYALIPAFDLLHKKVRYKKDALWTSSDYQFILPGIPSQSPKEQSNWLNNLCESSKTFEFSSSPIANVSRFPSEDAGGEEEVTSCMIPEKIMPMNAWLIFMGFFIAEGWAVNHDASDENPNTKIEYKVVLSQKKPIQCAMIEKTLDELNITYNKKPNDSDPKNEGCFDYYIFNRQLWAYLRSYSPGALKKTLPEWVWNLSKRQCNILLEALIAGDGTVSKISERGSYRCYHSSSPQLINDISRLILHAGYAAFTKLNPLRPNRSPASSYSSPKNAGKTQEKKILNKLVLSINPSWSVNVLSDRYSPFVNLRNRGRPVDDKLVYYKGPVYCLTVPNEIFYVEREGKGVWTGNSQLSQFMDQLNPLAEITHKRRLSSMGPGGVTRDSATLAIRGIHPTHYGRICPIETPEGKNTGLVNSLTTYARANSNGFLESPFYKVYKGQVQKNDGIYFFSADQEEKIKVAAADVSSLSGRISFLPKSKIPAKITYGDTISKISRNIVEYIGVSPIQMISIATSLIPFLEHDDANRALMGSNMQRQAVPLIRAERPLVGTGLESRTISDSGHSVIANESGYVAYVSAKKIVLYTIPKI